MASNVALVMHGIEELSLEEVPVPESVKTNEVLVRINYCGICGTDLHLYHDGHVGKMKYTEPFIIGHEASAVVVKVGSDVHHLQEGDRVAIEPSTPCRNCDYCFEGRYNFCEKANVKSRGLPTNDGLLTRYAVHMGNLCYKVPDNVSQKEAALTEPLACALYGVQRTGVKIGDKVLIVGAGAIGLLSLVCAKAFGADNICVADINRERLNVAEKLGADSTVVVNKDDTPEQLADRIQQCIGKVNVTLECSGSQIGTHSAILASQFGAKIAIVGIGPDLITIPVCELLYRQIDMLGSNKFTNNMKLALYMMETGKIDVKPIISHVFPLEKWSAAFETVEQQKGLKVLIEC